MNSQQSYSKHQNCDLPNFFSEFLELEGNSFTTIDHNEADDHHHDQQSQKSPKSSAQDFTTSRAVGTEFPIFSDGHHHDYILDHQRNGVVFYTSSKEAPRISANKQRIKWTEDLHEQFVECVNRLGGAEMENIDQAFYYIEATPKNILKLMNKNMLTIFHIKSHLQKYRTSKHIADYKKEKSENIATSDGTLDMKSGMHIKEALQNVNNRLHEQLEIQHNLQLLIEEQGKQMKMMLQQQQKTNNNLLMKSMHITADSQMQDDPCNSFSTAECSGSYHFSNII
ncbi:Myb family transcription factor APL [Morus notabilis]|uniref:Myb family transcription factor APL n=1 Tax=Morus notabilis TaxID=981085 RepID=W9RJ10_9ROSA|nr:Myb family transcription factor APL [Morus notabilis]